MDEKPSIIPFHDSLTELLLKTVYDDVVEVEYIDGLKGRLFIKFYQGEVIYFDENALYHLHGTAMATLFDVQVKNIYTALKSVENAITKAKNARYAKAKLEVHSSSSISQEAGSSSPRKPGRPKKRSVNSEVVNQHYPNAIAVSMMDGIQKRHYKLYPPAIITLIIGRARGMNAAALDFVELTTRLFKLHSAVNKQMNMEAYRLGYEDGLRAAALLQSNPTTANFQNTQSFIEANSQRTIEAQQRLIETQRELSTAYRKILRLQKTQIHDPLEG